MPVASQRGQLPGQRNIRATRMCYGVEQVLDRPSITDEHKDRVEERQRDFVIAPRGVRARSSIESALTAGEKAGEERRGEERERKREEEEEQRADAYFLSILTITVFSRLFRP